MWGRQLGGDLNAGVVQSEDGDDATPVTERSVADANR